MARVREREWHASLAALGVTEHHLLGLTDGTCAAAPHDLIVAHLAHIIGAVAPDTIVTFGPDGMTGHEDHQTVSAWATDAHALAAPDARLLYATTTEEFARDWEPDRQAFNVFLAEGLPLRTPTAELAVRLGWTPTPPTARSLRCGRRPARPPACSPRSARSACAVVVDRDVRRGAHRPCPRAGVGHLAGGGMTTTLGAPTRVVGRAVRDTAPVVLAYAPFGLALGATLAATHLPAADRVVVLAAAVRRRRPTPRGAVARRRGGRGAGGARRARRQRADAALQRRARAAHRRVARPLAVAWRLLAGRPRLRAGDHPVRRP